MNNDKEFAKDPLFKDLRKFAAKQTGPEAMPAELFAAFREAKVTNTRSKWIGRTVVGVIFASVALPSLAAAHVLPTPVANIVHKVVHVVSAPIRVVASVVTSDPLPTTSPASAPTPEPTNSSAPVTPTTPAPTNAPVSPTPMATHKVSESKSGEHNNEGSEGSKKESKSSENENGGGAVPKLPTTGATKAPSVGGSSGEKSESGSSSKSESKSESKPSKSDD